MPKLFETLDEFVQSGIQKVIPTMQFGGSRRFLEEGIEEINSSPLSVLDTFAELDSAFFFESFLKNKKLFETRSDASQMSLKKISKYSI